MLRSLLFPALIISTLALVYGALRAVYQACGGNRDASLTPGIRMAALLLVLFILSADGVVLLAAWQGR